jgi:hypothetical protein
MVKLLRWIGGRTTTLLLNVHRVSDVRQIEIHKAEPLLPFEVQIVIAKLKRYKLPSSYQIPGKLIQAGDAILRSEIHKCINSISNKEDLPHQWKESIIAPVRKQGNKTDCSNYYRISLLSTSYKFVSNILLSRLSPCIYEITGDHQCGFWCNNKLTVVTIMGYHCYQLHTNLYPISYSQG